MTMRPVQETRAGTAQAPQVDYRLPETDVSRIEGVFVAWVTDRSAPKMNGS